MKDLKVLFFEQLRLRTSIASWFFVLDNLEGLNQNPSRNSVALTRTSISHYGNNNNNPVQNVDSLAFNDMKERVLELEKECLNMKQDLHELVKTRGS
ncbi:hypothetical protein CRG98_012744 [Punica granatum]|uniref:Uncharacterized protein n=1 Tax=Punica granatum TaxID=22663 RepID=A0A2I0KEE2_PUNGR|nr:hypothetical protein CRG98_012744 [Punica granatum]